MLSKLLRGMLFFLVAPSLLSLGYFRANTQAKISTIVTGSIYTQPVDPSGKLLLSSWLDPDGSDYDQYVWDNFTLQSNETITEIDWFGGYDPTRFGAGGPVLDFSVSIYPSIAAGTEPAVANPPLVRYQTGGNAGETSIGMVGGNTMYAYTFSLPTPFIASAGVKYWVQVIASQGGNIPDWCFAAGTGGDGSHYRWASGAGGDSGYRSVPADAAFTLLGPIPDTVTPTDTATETPTDTSTSTLTNTPTDTPTNTPTNTATDTPTNTPTFTPTNTSTYTPTTTLTNTPTYTPTPKPLSNTPGKVNGGGVIGSDKGGNKITFGFTINYNKGDSAPKGNLTYQDHKTNLRLKATSFDLLLIEGNHVRLIGTGLVNNKQIVKFEIELDVLSKLGQPDTFYIHIPALNAYEAGGALTGGNLTIH